MKIRNKSGKLPPKDTLKPLQTDLKINTTSGEYSQIKKQRIKKITIICYVSRIVLITLQCFCNYLVEDHKPDAFIYPRNNNEHKTVIDKAIEFYFGGLLRWDAQHFIFIAKEGHIFEKSCAFFPFYPLLVNFFGRSLHSITSSFVTLDNSLLVIGVALNVFIFKCSAVMLYKLSLMFLNEKLAYKATILFVFNPATIFFLAPYSESLFSFLTFWSVYSCAKMYIKAPSLDWKDITKVAPLMLSPFTRSNGLVNLGFAIYAGVSFAVKSKQKHVLFEVILTLGIVFCISVAPFFAFQEHIHYMFCSKINRNFPDYIIEYAQNNDDIVLPGQFQNQPYCDSVVFPLPYLYIQKTYWNVGFLGYYTFRKLPNFILALPVLFIMFSNIFTHIFVNFKRMKDEPLSIFDWKYLETRRKIANQKLLYQPHLNVFVVHSLFLCLFCLFFVHIEVSTRMICSSTPLFYWYCTNYLESKEKTDSWHFLVKNRTEFFLFLYYSLYIFLGILLFSNFFPWT